MDKLAGEFAQLHLVPGLHHPHGNVGNAVLLELEIHQGQGELGAVEGRGHLPQDIGRGADMILVSVGKQIAPHVLFLFHQVADVGDHQIDPQQILLGEDAAAVHHDNIVLIFKDGHVLADFVHAAQGYNAELALLLWLCHSRTHKKPPFSFKQDSC